MAHSTAPPATLSVHDLDGGRVVQVDCPHATTTVAYLPARGDVADDRMLTRLTLAKHYAEEGCRCTRHLRRRYGLEVRR
jgi:hypothetical protein